VLLQGNLREFNLPNIFQLVKMSAKSGALTIRREGEMGRVFFRNGLIYYAFAAPQRLPLGERLVGAGAITGDQLKEALLKQRKSGGKSRIGTILLEMNYLDRATLETAVREQIQDTAFDFFSWSDGDFEFAADEAASAEDIIVELNVENVIMEGCRRIAEWELMFQKFGSLEQVAHLSYCRLVDERGELTLTAAEWRILVHIDGRADINTILRDCGMDRFRGAKVIYSLFERGLISVSEPMIEGIGSGVSVAVRGPIDIYNEVFLNTLTDSNVVKQLRVELIDEQEVEIPVIAGQVQLNGEGDEEIPPEEILVFTAASSCPQQAWKRLAGESSAWIVLANANDHDSLRSTKADLAFIRSLGDVPLVVATYVSMADEELSTKQIAKTLGVTANTRIIPCRLRDRESVTEVVQAALDLVKA